MNLKTKASSDDLRTPSSGGSYVLTLATDLRQRRARYGVLGVCVGSGQGVALTLENPEA
jgi:acetyl-CoA acetyltransferase